jgi:outer membrane lipase/esterase
MSRVSFPALVVAGWLILAGPARAQDASLVRAAGTPPQRAVSVVVAPPGRLCQELVQQFSGAPGARGDLRDRCTELVVAADNPSIQSQVQAGLQAMAPEEVPTQGTVSLEMSTLQTALVRDRLEELRGGANGLAVGGMTVDVRKPRIPGQLVASLSPGVVLAAQAQEAPESFPRFGVFLNGTLGFTDKDATTREAGFDSTSVAVTGGIDYRIMPNLIVGLSLGYTSIDTDLTAPSGRSLDSDAYSASLYGTYYVFSAFYVDATVSGGLTSLDSKRAIQYSIPAVSGGTTTVDQTATGETDGTFYSLGASAGYDFTIRGFTLSPFGRVIYTRTETDGYRESIPGSDPGFGLPLDVDAQDVDSLLTILGAQVVYPIVTRHAVLAPLVRFEWAHEFLNDSRPIRSQFQEDPTPDERTTIQFDTDSPDQDFFTLGAGVSATFRGGISAFALYETVLGLRDVTSHRVTAGVRYAF